MALSLLEAANALSFPHFPLTQISVCAATFGDGEELSFPSTSRQKTARFFRVSYGQFPMPDWRVFFLFFAPTCGGLKCKNFLFFSLGSLKR